MKAFPCLIFFFTLAANVNLGAIDLWQHPEAAERNSLFAGAMAPQIVIDGFDLLITPHFTLDYMLPVHLPISFGAFIKTPSPNLNSFGARFAYHINLDRPGTNLYFMYVFDFGFIRNDILERYGDERRPVRFFDFRAGLRQRLNHFLFIQIESDFQFRGIFLGLSVKVL